METPYKNTCGKIWKPHTKRAVNILWTSHKHCAPNNYGNSIILSIYIYGKSIKYSQLFSYGFPYLSICVFVWGFHILPHVFLYGVSICIYYGISILIWCTAFAGGYFAAVLPGTGGSAEGLGSVNLLLEGLCAGGSKCGVHWVEWSVWCARAFREK